MIYTPLVFPGFIIVPTCPTFPIVLSHDSKSDSTCLGFLGLHDNNRSVSIRVSPYQEAKYKVAPVTAMAILEAKNSRESLLET
jgi:hypothetical protein